MIGQQDRIRRELDYARIDKAVIGAVPVDRAMRLAAEGYMLSALEDDLSDN